MEMLRQMQIGVLGVLLAIIAPSGLAFAQDDIAPNLGRENVAIEGYDDSDDMAESYANSGSGAVEVYDPFEPFNRGVHGLNQFLDQFLFSPIIQVYRFVVPEPGRQMVNNAVRNIGAPVTIVNAALQGEGQVATETFWRFVINSTWGIGGLFDVAQEAGLEEKKLEDFGQTMAVNGVEHGPYLELPILGPTTVRDAGGRVVDFFFNPLNFIMSDEALMVRAGLTVLDAKHQHQDSLQELEKVSLDPYSAVRSLYIQYRDRQVKE